MPGQIPATCGSIAESGTRSMRSRPHASPCIDVVVSAPYFILCRPWTIILQCAGRVTGQKVFRSQRGQRLWQRPFLKRYISQRQCDPPLRRPRLEPLPARKHSILVTCFLVSPNLFVHDRHACGCAVAGVQIVTCSVLFNLSRVASGVGETDLIQERQKHQEGRPCGDLNFCYHTTKRTTTSGH